MLIQILRTCEQNVLQAKALQNICSNLSIPDNSGYQINNTFSLKFGLDKYCIYNDLVPDLRRGASSLEVTVSGTVSTLSDRSRDAWLWTTGMYFNI